MQPTYIKSKCGLKRFIRCKNCMHENPLTIKLESSRQRVSEMLPSVDLSHHTENNCEQLGLARIDIGVP